jgi:hypothetical protein
MYLQLAENNYLAASPNELYIFIPQGFKGSEKDMYIREDLLDNLPQDQYNDLMMQLTPYQPQGMSELSDRASRKAARQARKATKGGPARREAKQKRIETRAAARASGGGVLNKVIGAATNIFGKGETMPTQRDFSITGSPDEFTASFNNADGEESFFERNKTPLLIGGAVLVAGGIYLATRKK